MWPDVALAVGAGTGCWVVARSARRAPLRSRVARLGPAGPGGHAAIRLPAAVRRRVLVLSEGAGVDLTPEGAVGVWVAGTVAAAGVGTVVAPGLGVFAAGATAIGLPWGLRRSARRAEARRVDAVPVLLEHVAGELRSGSTVVAAFDHLGAQGPDVAGVARPVGVRLALGGSVDEALEAWRAGTGGAPPAMAEAVRVASCALAVAVSSGGRSAGTLDAVARGLRDRTEVAAEARALATQARVSAMVVAAAPPVHLALSLATGTDAAAWLVGTPVGLACLGLAAGLMAAAAWWMQRIVEGAR